jgi:hypothetical protein
MNDIELNRIGIPSNRHGRGQQVVIKLFLVVLDLDGHELEA